MSIRRMAASDLRAGRPGRVLRERRAMGDERERGEIDDGGIGGRRTRDTGSVILRILLKPSNPMLYYKVG